jgi:hypothetical protein
VLIVSSLSSSFTPTEAVTQPCSMSSTLITPPHWQRSCCPSLVHWNWQQKLC